VGVVLRRLNVGDGHALRATVGRAVAQPAKRSPKVELGADMVDWGGTSKRQMNEWVTVDALHVLKAAGRLLTPT
jgi:hypothetical protein